MTSPAAWPGWRADLFDADRVPFSRRGSFLAVSRLAEEDGLWLRSLRGGDEHTDAGRLFRLEVLDPGGTPVPHRAMLAPDCLTLETPVGAVRLAFADADTIAIEGDGAGLRLTLQPQSYDYAQRLPDRIRISQARQDLSADVLVTAGRADLDAPWQGLRAERIRLDLLPGPGGRAAATLRLFRIRAQAAGPVDLATARADAAADFAAWRDASLPVAPGLEAGRLLAAYITWSCMVPAEGVLTRPAMYMSKNWMTNIWSWDHCFNALALGATRPDAAWEQMAALFDQQDTGGRLPDFVNDRFAYWRFTKPPVHGWTFARLRAMAPDFYDDARLGTVYGWLSRQADAWMEVATDGLPAYDHGNDAGWDNATIFLAGTPLQSPDLATFLVLQMRELAAIATRLGRAADATAWTGRADALRQALIGRLWTGGRFVARLAGSGRIAEGGDSLIAFLPLLLGPELPAEIRQRLLDGLLAPGRFLTAHGLATEARTSPYYDPDGYWRGPIWAPVAALFVDALDRCGAPDQAAAVAAGFTRMADRVGMFENYDAETGQGRRDPAFTWTSSVFLLLGHRLLGHRLLGRRLPGMSA